MNGLTFRSNQSSINLRISNMKLVIPLSKLSKSIDEVKKICRDSFVDVDTDADAMTLSGEQDDLLDCMIAYNDLDLNAAKQAMTEYGVPFVGARESYTPEIALQKVNDFIIAKGGFKDYDVIFEVLNNAINGIV